MKADLEIVNEVKNGNKAAFAELVKRHNKLILRLAIRMTRDLEQAEDIVQESFIKAYRKLHLFEARASFKSWLYQIALNTGRNKLRAKKKDHISIDNVNLSFQPEVERGVFQKDIKTILKAEIDTLPKKQKLALSLRIFDDLSFKEIAEIMGCPYDTAKANYRHALMKLRHKFETNEELKELKEFSIKPKAILQGAISEVE